MRTILFIDYSYSGFGRYAASLVKELKRIDSGIAAIGVYMEPSENDHRYCFADEVCAEQYHYDAKALFKKYSPDAIVVFAHRFFDYMFTIEAHRNNIIVINFQHALYQESNSVSTTRSQSIVNLIKHKSKQVNIYAKSVSKINEGNIIGTMKTWISLFGHGNLHKSINKQFGDICNADVSMVFGSFYVDFYQKYYLETNTEYKVIGYPELESKTKSASGLFKDTSLPTVCYLAQAFVEDGKIKGSEFREFVHILSEIIPSMNLIIKPHPHTNIELYDELHNHSDHLYIWREPEFPEVDAYIGHDSTTIIHALYLTSKVLIYRLMAKENELERYTKYVSDANSFRQIFELMLTDDAVHTVSNELMNYCFYNEQGAIKTSAEIIKNKIC